MKKGLPVFFLFFAAILCFTGCGGDKGTSTSSFWGSQIDSLLNDSSVAGPLLDSLHRKLSAASSDSEAIITLVDISETYPAFTHAFDHAALDKAKQVKNEYCEAYALLQEIVLYNIQSNYDTVNVLLDRVQAIGEKLHSGFLLRRHAFFRAARLRYTYKTPQALALTDSVITISLKAKDELLFAKALHQKAELLRRQTKFDSAAILYDSVYRVSDRIGYAYGKIVSTENRAVIYGIRADYHKCDSMLARAIEISEATGERRRVINIYGRMGDVRYLESDNPRALEMYNKATLYSRRWNNYGLLALNLASIAQIYGERDDSANTMKCIQEALDVGKLSPDRARDANLLEIRANILKDTKHYEMALVDFDSAFMISKRVQRINGIDNGYYYMGSCYYSLGQIDTAESYFKRSIVEAEKIGDYNRIATSWEYLCDIYRDRHEDQLALDAAAKAVENAKLFDKPEVIGSASEDLSRSYEDIGDYKNALEQFKMYKLMNDSFSNGTKTEKFAEMEFAGKSAELKLQQEKKDAVNAAEQKQKEEELDHQKKITWMFTGGFILVLLLALLIFRSLQQNRKKTRIISEQKTEVEKQKLIAEEHQKEILDSINYAKRIQDVILPQWSMLENRFPESFVLFKPKGIVSGDFYWFAEKNGIFLAAAVDCTGHGVPGALMSMIGNAFLQEIVNQNGITAPSEILGELRHHVIAALKQKGESGEQRDGMDMAIVAIRNENDETKLEFAGANNPLWIIRDRKCIEIVPDKRPIGFFRGKGLPFTNVEVDVKKNDVLVLFTDGFADQFGGPKGKKFKYKQLEEKLCSISSLPMNEQKNRLDKTFEDWKGNLEQIDDVCILAIRI